jgi:hypothetical protein
VTNTKKKNELKSPIKIDLCRKPSVQLEIPQTPYGRCEKCQYVSTELVLKRTCPICKGDCQEGYTLWPDPELEELWRDEVAMWNDNRVELAAIVSAMYFEASVFHLMFLSAAWLDQELNWVGCSVEDFPDKERKIWDFLNSIRNRNDIEKALKRLFCCTSQEMLIKTLGQDDAKSILKEYRKLAEYRNKVIHQGKRSMIRTNGETPVVSDPNSEAILDWCLKFIPICWNVFAKLHNEFIHKPIWEKEQKEK